MKKVIHSNTVAGFLILICFQLLVIDAVIIQTADHYLTNIDNVCEIGALIIISLLIARDMYLKVKED